MFVFTNVIQVDDPMGDVTIGALVELVVRRGVPYVPVVLHCDQSEHRRRIVALGRSDRRKWTDVDAIETSMRARPLAPPEHADRLDLDVTSTAPETTAATILAHVATIAARPST